MIPIVDDFKLRFGLDDFIVIADSGFIIKRNIELLRSGKYCFIVGARIRSGLCPYPTRTAGFMGEHLTIVTG